MPTHRVYFEALSFTIDSDEIAAVHHFIGQEVADGGTPRTVAGERRLLEDLMRNSPDRLLAWYIAGKANSILNLRPAGPPVKSAADGELITSTTRFRSLTVTWDANDVGRWIQVPRPTTPPSAAGFYRIVSVVNANLVQVEGVIAQNATGLSFNVYERGEINAVLQSLSPA